MRTEDLEKKYRTLLTSNPREAAEVAYVLAVLFWRSKENARARAFAQESVRLFEQLNVRTFEDAAARFVTLEGVALPSYIHEGVVKQRLASLLEEQ